MQCISVRTCPISQREHENAGGRRQRYDITVCNKFRDVLRAPVAVVIASSAAPSISAKYVSPETLASKSPAAASTKTLERILAKSGLQDAER